MIKEDHWPVKHFRETVVKKSAMLVMLSQPSKLQPETQEDMQAVNQLIQQCRDLAHEYPACVVQHKNRDFYEREGHMEQTVLYLRHLDGGIGATSYQLQS